MRIGGVDLPDKINLNKTELKLNGAAVRSKFFVQTYVIALYAAEKITDEKTAIESHIERSLRMQITTPLATPKAVSENILSGMREGLGELYHLQKDLVEDLRRVIEASGVQYKDAIDIYYTKKGELKLYKNGREIYHNKDGKHFAQTILNIYLGKRPKDHAIKRALLKGST
jgi:membrane-bound inhibitor of C-type lysozyme